MNVPDTAPTLGGPDDDIGMLAWLMSVAQQSRTAEDVTPAVIPVAWMGRTSTDDQQDPTLSLPRQLEACRTALPAQFVIVAKFYDVESGRNDLDLRGHGTKHERLDIPIARDGGIADLLTEAQRPDRRFVAVICESIERVARLSYFSTKIEYELGQAGVVLLASDEGVDAQRVLPRAGGARPKQATQILTRRIKQAISEWYVLNMLELSWDGFREHTRQGWNIGKPPYGYLAERHPHPVKAKRDDGKAKTRLVADPVRGPVVTQIFQWRALERLSAQDIADRLNLYLVRFPPPEPIPGEGRRAVGAWTKTAVRDLLLNPKYTGYMVWNRRKRSRPERRVSGRVNPPSEWVWSQQPTHEPLVTRALFNAATPVARIREGSRGGAGPNAAHPHTRRSYVLRSYVYCDICGRRMFGKTRRRGDRERTYYACVINREHHREQPWYPDHPTSALVREEPIMDAVGRFFAERVLGPGRHLYLRPSDQQTQPVERRDAAQRTALTARLDQLTRAQANLMAQLEAYTPTGDDEIDTEWRTALQTRFTTIAAERKIARSQLNALDAAPVPAPRDAGDELALLANLPCTSRNLTLLPEAEQRQLYEAFHLQVRYNRATNQVTLRVTISAATVNGLAAVVHAAVDDTTPGAPTDDAPPPAISDDDGSHATGGMPGAHSRFGHVGWAAGRVGGWWRLP